MQVGEKSGCGQIHRGIFEAWKLKLPKLEFPSLFGTRLTQQRVDLLYNILEFGWTENSSGVYQPEHVILKATKCYGSVHVSSVDEDWCLKPHYVLTFLTVIFVPTN